MKEILFWGASIMVGAIIATIYLMVQEKRNKEFEKRIIKKLDELGNQFKPSIYEDGVPQLKSKAKQQYIETGINFMQNNDYDAANKIFDEYLKRYHPSDNEKAAILGLIGISNCGKGEYETALAQLNEMALIADRVKDNKALGDANANIAYVYFNSRDLQKALEYSQKAFEIYTKAGHSGGQAVSFNNKGMILLELCRHEEALEAFEKAVELKPTYASAWLNEGVVMFKLKRSEEALRAFEKALELKPDCPTAWSDMGAALDDLDRHEDALRAFEKALELKPNYAEAWSNKGVALAKLNRYDDALKAFERALELKPDYAEVWHDKACCYSLMKNKSEALKSLAKAIQLDSENKKMAKSDEDFKWLWKDEDFKKLIAD